MTHRWMYADNLAQCERCKTLRPSRTLKAGTCIDYLWCAKRMLELAAEQAPPPIGATHPFVAVMSILARQLARKRKTRPPVKAARRAPRKKARA